jgi:outer membrane biogenesis lipoprotein LolB
MPSKFLLSLAALAATFLTACTAPLPSSADLDKLTKDIVARSFRAEGQASSGN